MKDSDEAWNYSNMNNTKLTLFSLTAPMVIYCADLTSIGVSCDKGLIMF